MDGCEENIRKQEKHTARYSVPSEPQWQGQGRHGDKFSRASGPCLTGARSSCYPQGGSLANPACSLASSRQGAWPTSVPGRVPLTGVGVEAVPVQRPAPPGHPRATRQLTGPRSQLISRFTSSTEDGPSPSAPAMFRQFQVTFDPANSMCSNGVDHLSLVCCGTRSWVYFYFLLFISFRFL